MSHSVSTAQKYYNIQEQAHSDFSRGIRRKETRKKDEDQSPLFNPSHVKNKFVPDPVQQAEDQPQERPGDVEICFVPDTAVMTNLDACEDQPTGGRTKEDEDRREEGSSKNISGLAESRSSPTQANIQPEKNWEYNTTNENAVGYMHQKSKMNLTFADKCKSWLQTGQIHNVAASTTSSSGARRYWTELQGELVKKATLHLPYSAKASDIFGAVSSLGSKFGTNSRTCQRRNNNCKYHSIALQYSGEASPTFGHANFSVFIDRIRNQFQKK